MVTLIFGIVWFSLHRDIYEVKVIDIWPLYCITLSKLHWLRTPDHPICKNRDIILIFSRIKSYWFAKTKNLGSQLRLIKAKGWLFFVNHGTEKVRGCKEKEMYRGREHEYWTHIKLTRTRLNSLTKLTFYNYKPVSCFVLSFFKARFIEVCLHHYQLLIEKYCNLINDFTYSIICQLLILKVLTIS